MTPEDLDELAEPYARIALDLATRVRDDDPVAVHRWLLQEMDGRDWLALAVVQACATPIDVPWSQLTAWTWLRQYSDGRPDTDAKVLQRQRDLLDALDEKLRAPRKRKAA